MSKPEDVDKLEAIEVERARELVEIPTAVTVKPVLALIAAHCDGDKNRVKEKALEIAEELELNNKQELADYIYAQYHLIPTFSPGGE